MLCMTTLFALPAREIGMVKLDMVRETTGRQRHRLFTYHRYLEILNRGTELPNQIADNA
jgi:hypothetical protein